jgi:hypothetical protein
MNNNFNLYQNGRVIDLKGKQFKPPQLFENNNNNNNVENNFEKSMMTGIFEPTTLNKLYFSKENLNIIQDQLRHNVYIKSNNKYIVDKQSDVDLQIIMRSIFLQHSPNLQDNITKQIEYLNKLVIDWATPRIITEIEQYNGYINEVQYMPTPIDRPKNLSSKGEKTLKSVTTTF